MGNCCTNVDEFYDTDKRESIMIDDKLINKEHVIKVAKQVDIFGKAYTDVADELIKLLGYDKVEEYNRKELHLLPRTGIEHIYTFQYTKTHISLFWDDHNAIAHVVE